jgi:hypothetical protein
VLSGFPVRQLLVHGIRSGRMALKSSCGEDMTALPLAPAYREAVKVALVFQVIATLVLLMILDGGTLARAGGAAMAGFWLGVAAAMLRRPTSPTAGDLLYVRWGYPVLLAIGVALSPFMGVLRG